MSRRLICLLLTVYAIAFAFGALTAVRWPSIVMVMGWIVQDDVRGGLDGVNWRELGIVHGSAYLFAALGYYASSALLGARKGGAVAWYLFALAASVPAVFLVHFHPRWWENPTAGEGALAGLMAGALLLLIAVWELRKRAPDYVDVEVTPETLAHPAVAAAVRGEPLVAGKPVKVKKPHPPLFVPDIMVARQRALFIAQARARQARRAQIRARRHGEGFGEEEDAA
ncbi:MAG: hypothetical protein ACK4HR_00890 [Hyphomonas sp.]|jgi:hypothetical protein